jgi:putative Mn2+ efflux pump MntP
VVALLLVAVALGLSNFAASIGLGAGGAGAARVAVVFGAFEAGMPVAGLALGSGLARSLGHGADWLGGAILIAVGGYTLLSRGNGDGAGDAGAAGDGATGAGATGAGATGDGVAPGGGGPAPRGDPAAGDGPAAGGALGRLLLTGFALSLDNLAAGFALGAYHVAFWVAALVIGVVSVAMSLVGLRLGARLGRLASARTSQLAAGVVLVAVGTIMAAGVL